MMMRKVPNTEARVRRSSFLPESPGSAGFRIFSAKSAAGAKSVPEAVDIIAESSAQKKSTCSRSGACSSISAGRIL